METITVYYNYPILNILASTWYNLLQQFNTILQWT